MHSGVEGLRAEMMLHSTCLEGLLAVARGSSAAISP